MNKLTSITNKYCPYARKVKIALRQKGSDFKQVDEDLKNKSQFFKESYSKSIGRTPERDGAVPIIIDNGVYMTESEPLVWYIAEKYRNVGLDLLPNDPVEVFKIRIFIQEYVKKLIGLQSRFFGWSKKSQEDKQKITVESTKFFESLNNNLVQPYAFGQQFTVADILIYPHFQLWNAIQHFTTVGIDKKLQNLHKYISLLQTRKSIQDCRLTDETYITQLGVFF